MKINPANSHKISYYLSKTESSVVWKLATQVWKPILGDSGAWWNKPIPYRGDWVEEICRPHKPLLWRIRHCHDNLWFRSWIYINCKKIQTPNTKTTVQQCVLIVFRINQSHIKHRLNVSFMPLTVTSGHWPLEILPCGVSESNAATLH